MRRKRERAPDMLRADGERTHMLFVFATQQPLYADADSDDCRERLRHAPAPVVC
jgi:hypothetical protein